MLTKLTIIILVIIQLINVAITDQPYQVTIWLKNDPSKPLCNGIVIHERLILTTATCLRNTTVISSSNNNTTSNNNTSSINLNSDTTVIPITTTVRSTDIDSKSNESKFVTLNASEILILAGGSSNDINLGFNLQQQQKRINDNVLEIEIASNFNSTSLENDIALLKLNESLALATRRDIQWISLDDHLVYKNTSCRIGFYNFMTRNNQEIHTVNLMNNSNCTNTTTFQSPRKRDICSLYVNPYFCNLSANELARSSDIGTGLVCDSKLIGVLSQIIPRDNKTKCSSSEPLKAIYTRVSIHLNWIYEKIAIESMVDLGKSNYILAPPYKESAPSPHIEMPGIPNQEFTNAPSTTTTTTTTTSTPTRIPPVNNGNHNEGGSNIGGTTNNSTTQKPNQSQNTSTQKVGKSSGILSKSISLSTLSISILIFFVSLIKIF